MATVCITTSSFAKGDATLLQLFLDKGYKVVLNPFERRLTEEEVANFLGKYRPVGLIAGIEPLTRAVLTGSKGLKVISRCGIGLDSVDLEASNELGIVVTNTPDVPTIPVAELTLGLILSLMRGIHLSNAAIRNGEWKRPMGFLLNEKTVGIIGCGRIGSRLAQLLRPFCCRVLGFDLTPSKNELFEPAQLGTILSKADIVCLHLPYSEANHHFMNSERLQLMKPGAILVNTARGGLVDENALYLALSKKHLGGAALDCFENEPYTGPLIALDNVLLTGHIGSYARESRIRMERQSVENLIEQLDILGS